MSRRATTGGTSTQKRKASPPRKPPSARRRPEDTDPDAIDPADPRFAGVDWEALPRHTLEIDPLLVEKIRARRKLKQITLRIGEEQIAEAMRVSERTGTPYQVVLRRWLAEGASHARMERMREEQQKRR